MGKKVEIFVVQKDAAAVDHEPLSLLSRWLLLLQYCSACEISDILCVAFNFGFGHRFEPRSMVLSKS